ncbi:Protein of unknown function [Desulfonauticus submarinus]|uniref:Lipocalin-like domain-containing protein n=1 Tax=Desulfonauticus submarinus TaxID=206665 RepID=A0A1G9ZK13_9BACT|nr:DUF3617 family protein [Desulfonauticus submarinus]SDN21351.1 Protein of unknown function [Desulfonauticus submarinus]
MKKLLAVCCMLGLLIGCGSSGPDLKEGQWKIKTKVIAKGLPFSMPSGSYTVCLTKDNYIPKQGIEKKNEHCKITDQSVSGNTVHWKMECDDNGVKMTMTSEITYSGDTLNGKYVTQYGGMSFTTEVSGKWIGKCE